MLLLQSQVRKNSQKYVGTLAGLLEHAKASNLFTTPTINGYKRYKPNSLAPNRIVWGKDNKGAMLRLVGRNQ